MYVYSSSLFIIMSYFLHLLLLLLLPIIHFPFDFLINSIISIILIILFNIQRRCEFLGFQQIKVFSGFLIFYPSSKNNQIIIMYNSGCMIIPGSWNLSMNNGEYPKIWVMFYHYTFWVSNTHTSLINYLLSFLPPKTTINCPMTFMECPYLELGCFPFDSNCFHMS